MVRGGLSLAVALVATPVLAACQPTSIGDLTSKDFTYCTILADPPQQSAKKLVGPSHFDCDGGGADSITMTVTLQHLDSRSAWVTLTTDTFVMHGKETSRSPNQNARTRSVSVACASGKFRTVMHAVEASKGKTRTYDNHSVTVSNPCDH